MEIRFSWGDVKKRTTPDVGGEFDAPYGAIDNGNGTGEYTVDRSVDVDGPLAADR
jgi:hypothetical protein